MDADRSYLPEYRIYARGTSDDRVPIVVMLSALDALMHAGIPIKNNIKFIFEGEEEVGSPNLKAALNKHRNLLQTDVLYMCDGPSYYSGNPTLFFGVRGIVTLSLTVYGPSESLHSGHYGNWAPNPAVRLAHLLASMRSVDGRVLIEGFYDSVVGLETAEAKALAEVSGYAHRLKKANGVLFPMNTQELDGTLLMHLGVKGIIYFELEARGGKWGGPKHHEIHGSYKALVDSPAWRLIQALASLTTPDGNTITIPGYYDGIHAPTLEEERLINALADDIDFTQQKKLLGVDRWLDDLDGRDALIEYLYAATLNINGIWGGYTGEGSKTVLPHKAVAKLDSRLPPGLSPERAYRLIRAHLGARGFGDLRLRKLDKGYPAAQTSVSEPWVQAALGVFKKRRYRTQIIPRLAGSAPFYQFTQRLKLPLVFAAAGYGHAAHGPDEFMLIHPKPGVNLAGLAEVEKTYVDLVFAFAAMKTP